MPGNLVTRNASYAQNWDARPLYDNNGDLVAVKATNFRESFTLRYINVGVNFNAVGYNTYLPQPYSIVVLSNFPTMLNGYYNYIGSGTVEQVYNGKQVISLPLVRFTKTKPQQLARLMVSI